MQEEDKADQFKDLAERYFSNKISRRRFLTGAAQLGFSATLLSSIVPAAAADTDLIKSASIAPYESPITKERVAYLKKKPYKGVTLNVLAVKATVGDSLKYHAKRWSEQTGARVNVAEVPIDTLHTQIFSDLTSGLGRYDAYQTAAWFYGDFFTPKTPYVVPIHQFLNDKKFPY